MLKMLKSVDVANFSLIGNIKMNKNGAVSELVRAPQPVAELFRTALYVTHAKLIYVKRKCLTYQTNYCELLEARERAQIPGYISCQLENKLTCSRF